jgi:hypothetical protein
MTYLLMMLIGLLTIFSGGLLLHDHHMVGALAYITGVCFAWGSWWLK